MKKKRVAFLKKHAVLVAAAVCAAASAFFVPPDETYFSYLDLRVLCLLFSLMVVVAGLQSCNLFAVLSQKLLQGKRNLRALVLLLVLLPFFSSMLITNDVALITFVPFAILVLSLLGERRHLIKVIVLQTVAANLGSMATPFGNPQNLYLYTTFSISPLDFLLIMGKFTGCSLLLLLLCGFLFPKEILTVCFPQKAAVSSRLDVILYGMLFVCCLLAVLHVLPYWAALVLVAGVTLWRNPSLLKRADLRLLFYFLREHGAHPLFSGPVLRLSEHGPGGYRHCQQPGYQQRARRRTSFPVYRGRGQPAHRDEPGRPGNADCVLSEPDFLSVLHGAAGRKAAAVFGGLYSFQPRFFGGSLADDPPVRKEKGKASAILTRKKADIRPFFFENHYRCEAFVKFRIPK